MRVAGAGFLAIVAQQADNPFVSATRKSSATTSATLVALSLAICLGATTEASAATLPRAVEANECATLTTGQREALASLLARLTDAARKLHHAPPAAAALTSIRHTITRPMPTAHLQRPLDRPHSLPTPPLRRRPAQSPSARRSRLSDCFSTPQSPRMTDPRGLRRVARIATKRDKQRNSLTFIQRVMV